MKLCDLIYHYAQYCRVNVDAALLMENWTDKDCDEKYANYLQEYLRLKPILSKSKNIKDAVSLLQTERVKEIYEELFKLIIKELKAARVTMSKAKISTIRERLYKAAPISNEIDYNFVKEARKIEEEEY
jgi:hypothetical protein